MSCDKGHLFQIFQKSSDKWMCSVPSSVLNVSYQNISSTSILVSWVSPLNPNGRITHYTVYGLKLQSNQALKWITNSTSILITGQEIVYAAQLSVNTSQLNVGVLFYRSGQVHWLQVTCSCIDSSGRERSVWGRWYLRLHVRGWCVLKLNICPKMLNSTFGTI